MTQASVYVSTIGPPKIQQIIADFLINWKVFHQVGLAIGVLSSADIRGLRGQDDRRPVLHVGANEFQVMFHMTI